MNLSIGINLNKHINRLMKRSKIPAYSNRAYYNNNCVVDADETETKKSKCCNSKKAELMDENNIIECDANFMLCTAATVIGVAETI